MNEVDRIRHIAAEELADALGVMASILVDELLARQQQTVNGNAVLLRESFLHKLTNELPKDVPAAAIVARIRARLERR